MDTVALAEQIVFCIQEGISNAVRHGHATCINLMLEQQSNVIKIFLDDNGRGLVASSGNGSGLQGMRERLVSYGGLVELSVLAQGCRLAISFNPSFKEITND